MLNFEYYSPTKIVFGKDTEGRTAELVKECGGTRVLIVYGGNSVIKNGLLSKVEKNLADNKIEYLSIGGVVPNPLLPIMSSPKSLNFRLFFKFLPRKTEQKMYDSHCILY